MSSTTVASVSWLSNFDILKLNGYSFAVLHLKSKKHYTTIKPKSGWVSIDWKELIDYKDLLYFLVKREISKYGTTTYQELVSELEEHAKKTNDLVFFQSNHEGEICDYIQKIINEKI